MAQFGGYCGVQESGVQEGRALRSIAARTAQQRQVWNKVAPDYDRQIAFFERVWFSGGREWLGARAVGDVLDVGIGTGRNLSYFGAATRVSGVDLSREMLRRAGTESDRLGRRVALIEADAAHLPYADGTFDSVVCALALCSIPEPERAIDQMYRVLKVGGRLLLLDHIRSSWPPLLAGQWLVEQVTGRRAGEWMTRRHLASVQACGFRIDEADRRKAGTVELISAIKD